MLAARDPAEERAVYRRLVEGRRTDGLIVARTRRDDQRIRYLAEARFPFVAIGRTETPLAYAHVDGDGESAFRAATERLIALGHRRIAFVAAPSAFTFGKLRRRGWASAMQAAGLRARRRGSKASSTEFGGLAAARALLAVTPRPTALLCATDRMAIGAHARRQGSRAWWSAATSPSSATTTSRPSAFTEPALTTMELSMIDVGARVADMLIALIGGADPRDLSEILPVIADRACLGRTGSRSAQLEKRRRSGRRRNNNDPVDGGKHDRPACAALVAATTLLAPAVARAQDVVFLSTQLRPIEEAQKVRDVLLKGAPKTTYVTEEPPQLTVRMKAEQDRRQAHGQPGRRAARRTAAAGADGRARAARRCRGKARRSRHPGEPDDARASSAPTS